MNAVRISMLATIALVAILVHFVFTHTALGVGPISIGLQVAALLLMIWARVTFGLRSFHAGANPTEGPLVTRGPYAAVRNPIYAAILLFLGVATAVHPSWTALGLFIIAIAAVLVRIFTEERELRVRYAEYGDYAGRVKRLVPLIF